MTFRVPGPLVFAGLAALLAGCEVEVEPPRHYDIPAYGWNTNLSVESSSWQRCYQDTTSGFYLRRQWRFDVTSLRITEQRYSSTDNTCSGSATLMWRHDYRAAEDNDLVAVRGWLDGSGTEILNGGAPDAQDQSGPLPAQPQVRRIKWEFNAVQNAAGTSPLPQGSWRQVLYLDVSADPFRLFVSAPGSTLDADSFPAYLDGTRPLRFVPAN